MPCTYYCKTVYSVHCFWCRPNLFQSWVLIPSLLTSSKFANDQFWLVLFFADDVVGNGRRAVFQKRSPPEEKRLPNEASFNQWYQSHILATLIQAKLYLTDTTYTYQKINIHLYLSPEKTTYPYQLLATSIHAKFYYTDTTYPTFKNKHTFVPFT